MGPSGSGFLGQYAQFQGADPVADWAAGLVPEQSAEQVPEVAE